MILPFCLAGGLHHRLAGCDHLLLHGMRVDGAVSAVAAGRYKLVSFLYRTEGPIAIVLQAGKVLLRNMVVSSLTIGSYAFALRGDVE
jgi:hypothetical protein